MNEDAIWCMAGDLTAEKARQLDPLLETISDRMGAEPPTLSMFEQKDTPLWRVELFFNGKPDDAFLSAFLKEAGLDTWPCTLEALPDRDWVTESQKLLAPVIAGRFVVHGSHDRDNLPDGKIAMLIEAGQAFGTGQHETTWACLATLDSLDALQPREILDLGTGSGVLAMAAHRLWPNARVLASDIDPVAIDVTRENLAANACIMREPSADTPGIAAIVADGMDSPEMAGNYDLVMANILAGPLIDMARDISMQLAPGGHLLLSGLLNTQKKEVLEAYKLQGLKVEGSMEKGEWLALHLTKPLDG